MKNGVSGKAPKRFGTLSISLALCGNLHYPPFRWTVPASAGLPGGIRLPTVPEGGRPWQGMCFGSAGQHLRLLLLF